MVLTSDQRTRYARNLVLPGFGESGQERLAAARVLIVGLGGLGGPAAFYLAAAGVGTLGLFDSDAVELSNLQRQILHRTNGIGRPKVESAAEALAALNPDVRTQAYPSRFTEDTARPVVPEFDVIVDGTDNFATKFLINDLCLEYGKPFATAGILAFSGYGLFVAPGRSPCLRCATPEIPGHEPTTAELGVLGAVPGVLGSLEAMEVLRWLVGLWMPQPEGCGLLHGIDGEHMRLRTLRIPRRPECRCAALWSQS